MRFEKGVIIKRIPGFRGYGATNTGHIVSYLSPVGRGDTWKVGKRPYRVLKPGSGAYNYKSVGVRAGGKNYQIKVHRLVARAFLGPCPEGHQVCHKNGISTDNRVKNLRYGTPARNGADKWRYYDNLSVAELLEDHPLTEVYMLCKKEYLTLNTLGQEYHLTRERIRQIVRRQPGGPFAKRDADIRERYLRGEKSNRRYRGMLNDYCEAYGIGTGTVESRLQIAATLIGEEESK